MLYAIAALIILLADQAMKYWTTMHLAENTGLVSLIPGVLDLRNIHNTGSAFSFMESWGGARWLFLAVTVLFAVLVIAALAKNVISGRFGRWMALGVLAGALGNGIDRACYGYVVDMFEFAFFRRFPVFNIADMFITVCGILFCLYILLHKEPIKAGETVYRKGPGGSVTTKPAPRPKEKPVREEKPARAAHRASAAPEAKEKPAAPRREAKPAAEKRSPAELLRRRSEPEKSAREIEFEKLSRPVVTHESFLEMTRRMPGDDPFAEWTRKAGETPVREVKPEPSVQIETAAVEDGAEAQSVSPEPETVPEAAPEAAYTAPAEFVPEPEIDISAVIRSAAAERSAPEVRAEAQSAQPSDAEPTVVAAPIGTWEAPKAVSPEPDTAADTDADAEYSLEDILSEFRDL